MQDQHRSGINGSGTSSQKAKGIKDDADIFLSDTLKGGAKKPEVAKVRRCFLIQNAIAADISRRRAHR